MSRINVPSPAPSSPATAPVPAQQGVNVFGLGVNIGVLETVTMNQLPQPADRFDRAAPLLQRETPRLDDIAPARDANPFESLCKDRSAAVDLPQPRKLCERRVGMERELDPPFAALAKLTKLEGKLVCEAPKSMAAVRQGVLLLTADGQEVRERQSPVAPQIIETAAQKLLKVKEQHAVEEFTTCLKLYQAQLCATRLNVQALVQRALRESYLLGNELLWEYATKLRHYNDLKDKTRSLLNKAQKVKALWATEQGALGEGKLFLGEPYPYETVDEQTGEVVIPKMTAEEVEEWNKITTAASGGGAGGGGDGWEIFVGPSQLTADNRSLLDTMLEENDSYIVARISQLVGMLPRMNKEDIGRYLAPIMDELDAGDAEEPELLQIFAALSPAQFLYVASEIAAPESLAERANASSVISASTYLGLIGTILAGCEVIRTGTFDDAEQAELDGYGRAAAQNVASMTGTEFTGVLTAEKAAELLAALEAKKNQPAPAMASDPNVPGNLGSPKAIRTCEEMKAYIDMLEERLNSIGDDAQLANVDLQELTNQQTQALQMMSNIAKMLHDGAMSIIRKSGV